MREENILELRGEAAKEQYIFWKSIIMAYVSPFRYSRLLSVANLREFLSINFKI